MAYHESGNFGPELEARIRHSAARLGREPEELAREVLTRYFEEEARFVDAVRRGELVVARRGTPGARYVYAAPWSRRRTRLRPYARGPATATF
jgi:plasmid stability protein